MPDESDSTELSAFIQDTLESIKSATKGTDFALKGDIEFELAVVTTKQAGGGVKIIVADIGGKYESEKLSKMKFSIGRKPNPIIAVSKR